VVPGLDSVRLELSVELLCHHVTVLRSAKLWDAGSGAVLQTLEGYSSYISAVTFSPDGKTLASALDDKTIKLWDAGSGAMLQTLEGHSDCIRPVAFSPDSKTPASASDGKTGKL
jgi:WD40 repeat protein